MIILINGTSSSGKSTLCLELQKRLNGWLNFSTDGYLSMLGEKFLGLHPDNKDVQEPNEICYAIKHEDGTHEIVPGKLCSQLYSTIPDVLQLIAKNGFNIIVDSFITTLQDLSSYQEKLNEFNLFSVYLYAPSETIKMREEARGDRLKGSAIHWLKQFEVAEHSHLVIDTAEVNLNQACEKILISCFGSLDKIV